MAGVQDVPGGDLQGVVLGACHRAAGARLVAAGGPALSCCVLLKRGSYSAAASLRIDSEGLDVAFQERFAIMYYRGPALLGADHLDQVAQEPGTPGAVKGGEHVRFQRMRDAGSQIAVLGQHAGRQDEHCSKCGVLGWTSSTCTCRPGSSARSSIRPSCRQPAGARGLTPSRSQATRGGDSATRLAA